MFESYKERTIKKGQLVEVYFHFKKKMFSIRDKKTGLVLGHSNTVHLTECTFQVNENDRQRVIKEQKKNVHAFVIGSYNGTENGTERKKAYYNPYNVSHFVGTKYEKLETSESVTLANRNIYYA